ncbi:MAG TPA: glycosyltransferase family 4 protein [Labilithrix sp.]
MHRAYRWNSGVKKIAILGNHLPRRCGIATFTSDLADAIASELRGTECTVLAMNEPGCDYDYPERVALEIGEGDAASYRRAADFVNVGGADVVSLQHEYGIFGGRAGMLVLDFVRDLRMPLVTTLHTILAEPNAQQRAVMDELTTLSERIVVMSANGAELLRSVHGVDPRKIDFLPHGIPAPPATKASKDTLGLEGNEVILTFGLLSPDKGIEYVIDALPEILAKRPNAVYVVVGVTHPHIEEREGQAYRFMLESRARRIGVDSNIVFHDRFVSHEELVQFLSAADIYVTPYLNLEQITSGTLAYAVGCGKAVISTPYRYACELLDGGRGVLVPPRDPGAIAREVIDVLSDDRKRRTLEERAASYGNKMTWPVVARGYLESFDKALAARKERQRSTFRAKTLARRTVDLPELDLSHVRMLTDDTGIMQHATFAVPRRADGYCLDDNARALLLTTMLEDAAVEPARSLRALALRYLSFVDHAFDAERGRFRNFMTYAREWADGPSSDDCQGRALWALGAVVGRSSDRSMRGLARRLWREAMPKALDLGSPRAWAYAVLGIEEYLRADGGDAAALDAMTLLANKLVALHRAASSTEWPWFEDRLTYCNARLAQALVVAGARTKNAEMLALGLRTLGWLSSVQTVEGTFSPVGSNGFWIRGERRAQFDQQPVEASGMISACLDAHRATSDVTWLACAERAFQWFLGRNQLELPLYDPVTGGCRDGLHEDRANENQGAESTLSFLLALVEMQAAQRVARDPARSVRPAPASESTLAVS